MFLDSIYSCVGLAYIRRLVLVNHRGSRVIAGRISIRVRTIHLIILLVSRDGRFVLYGWWRARVIGRGRRMTRPSTVMFLPIEFRLLVNRGGFLGDIRYRWRRATVSRRGFRRHVLGHGLIGDRFVRGRGGSFRYRVRDGLIAWQHHGSWHVATW